MQNNMSENNNNLLVSVFKNENTIDSQLPIKFKSGYKLKNFETKCNCCSATLTGDLVKGSVFKTEETSRFEFWKAEILDKKNVEDELEAADDNALENVMIDAVGFCPQCEAYTHCRIHVKDKGLTPEEAQEKERLLDLQRKANAKKSKFGLSLEMWNTAKSMKKKREELESIRKKQLEEKSKEIEKEFAAKKNQNNLKNSYEHELGEDLTSVNNSMSDVARKQQANLMKISPKFVTSIDNNNETAETISSSFNTTTTTTTSEYKEKTNIKKSNEIAKKLQEAISVDANDDQTAIENNQVASNSRAMRQAELMKRKPVKQATIDVKEDSKLESLLDSDSNSIKNGTSSMLLRGDINNDKNSLNENISDPNDFNNINNLEDKNIDRTKRKYVQKTGSLSQSLNIMFSRLFSYAKKVGDNREKKRNDLLNNYKYIKPTVKGGISAHERLLALKENNNEFSRKEKVDNKIRVKKHSHDSFK